MNIFLPPQGPTENAHRGILHFREDLEVPRRMAWGSLEVSIRMSQKPHWGRVKHRGQPPSKGSKAARLGCDLQARCACSYRIWVGRQTQAFTGLIRGAHEDANKTISCAAWWVGATEVEKSQQSPSGKRTNTGAPFAFLQRWTFHFPGLWVSM